MTTGDTMGPELEHRRQEALDRVGDDPDELGVRGLISYMDDFYTGVERLYE